MGTTLREIIFDIGGGIQNKRQFKAVQTGGPSGCAMSPSNWVARTPASSLPMLTSMRPSTAFSAPLS